MKERKEREKGEERVAAAPTDQLLLFFLKGGEIGAGILQFNVHVVEFLLHLFSAAFKLVVIRMQVLVLNAQQFQILSRLLLVLFEGFDDVGVFFGLLF